MQPPTLQLTQTHSPIIQLVLISYLSTIFEIKASNPRYYNHNLQSFVMFLEEFEQPQSKTNNRRKQPKKEYSAGFRNYHPQKSKPDHDSEPSTITEEDTLFQNLKIGNLKELYLQTLPKVDTSKAAEEQQQQSISRLTKPPQKEPQVESNKEEEDRLKRENDQLFSKRYHKTEGYSEKAEKRLFHNEFGKLKHRLAQICSRNGKNDFSETAAKFILHYAQKYQGKSKIGNDELVLDFGNFINSHFKIQDTAIQAYKLRELLTKNIFLFGFFDGQRISRQRLAFDDVRELIRKDQDIQIADSDIRLTLHKKITVPYQPQSISLAKTHQKQTTPPKNNQENEVFEKFHAKPVPKTTYDKPKERPKSQMSKTQPQPFNLTTTNPNIPNMQDYYKWQRQFHARDIPPTTYKPILIHTTNQDDKKRRALELLSSANYPQSMKYLNHLNQYQQQRQQQLASKYAKTGVRQHQKSVPNFAEIHKRQMEELEELKVENRPLTKPQPFNLSQPRPPKPQTIPEMPYRGVEQPWRGIQQFKEHSQKLKIEPRSTLKYDSYVSHLKKQKELKAEQQEKRKESQKKEQKPQLKQILKERLQGQMGHAARKEYPQLQQNTVKVDLAKIYQYEPLLIEREAAKNKKSVQNHSKSWQPVI